MQEQYVRANGVTLAFDEFGDQSHPAIILIMGLGTQMIAWPETLCRGLADQGFRVIRFDNRDIGLSEKMDDARKPNIPWAMIKSRIGLPLRVAYTLQDMADDTRGLMSALEIDAAHIVGASMGGMIAQLLTASEPDKVLSLTSIMSSSGARNLPSGSPEILRALTQRNDGGEQELLAQRCRVLAMIGSTGQYAPDPDELMAKVVASYRRSYYPPGYLRHMLAIMHCGSRVRQLQSIQRPTLVIHGKADPLVPVAAGIDTARHIQGSKLELIEDMGHDLPAGLIPHMADLITRHARSV
ncbi:MAG: alpha/beta hydrolase [Gammaproteobacteria bacterium]|nr:alpha/beta hydrolase [Gammaproteobacteria bacterium]